jgi:hypothetical protein
MESGAMCYMMGKEGYGGDVIPHWPPHLMFFFSDTDPATWGANLPGSPVFAAVDSLEHLTQFVIPVGHWSDGTEYSPTAPAHARHLQHQACWEAGMGVRGKGPAPAAPSPATAMDKAAGACAAANSAGVR